MSTVNENAFVKPKEKPDMSQQPPRRQFGTLLSANSPPRSTHKKGRLFLRSSASKRSPRVDEETIDFSDTTFTVTFDQGPIGLHLQPIEEDGSCRVERFSGAQSAALMSGKIEIGDIIQSVNGKRVAYDAALHILQDSTKRRTITFRRRQNLNQRSPKIPPSANSLQTVPLNDRSPHTHTPKQLSMAPKRILDESEPQMKQASTKEQLMLLNNRVMELEDENNELKLSQKHAIQEMEFNMRLQSLQAENNALKDSKAKLKKKLRDVDEKSSEQQTIEETNVSNETFETMKQKLEDLEGSLRESQAQTDSKSRLLEELAEAKRKMELQLLELKENHDQSAVQSNETNKRLLDSIRSKDLQIQKLAQDLIASEVMDTSSDSNNAADEARLSKALADLCKEKDHLQECVNELMGSLATSNQDKESLRARVEQLCDVKETQSRTIKEQQSQADQTQRHHAEAIKNAQTQNATLQEENSSLRLVMAQLQASVEDLSAQRSQLQQSLRKLDDRSKDKDESRVKETSQWKEELQTMQHQKMLMQHDVRVTQTRCNELVNELEEKRNNAQSLDDQNKQLMIENQNLSKTLKAVESENKHLCDEKQAISQQFEHVRDELKTHIIRDASKDRSIAVLHQSQEALLTENQAMKYEMKQNNNDTKLIQQLLKDKDCDLKASEDRFANLLQSYSSISDDNTRLSEQLQNHITLLGEKQRSLREAAAHTSRLKDEIRQLKDQHAIAIGSLEGEISVLNGNITRLQERRDTMATQLAASIQQSRLNGSKQEHEATQQMSSIQSLKDENVRIKTQWVTTTAALRALSDEKERVYDERLRLENDLHAAEKCIQDHHRREVEFVEQLSKARISIEDLNRETEYKVSENSGLKEATTQKDQEIKQILVELEAVNDELSKQRDIASGLQHQNRKLRNQFAIHKDTAAREQARLEQIVNDAFERNTVLSKDCENSKERTRAYGDQLVRLEKANSALVREISVYKEQLQTSATEKRDLNHHLHELKSEFKGQRDREASLQDELQGLRNDYEALQKNHADVNCNYNLSVDTVKELKSELKSNESRHRNDLSDLEQKLNNANIDLVKLRSTLNEKMNSASCLVADLRTEIKSAEAAKLRLTKEVSSFQRRIDHLTEAAQRHEVERAERDKAITDFESEVFGLKDKLSQIENDREKDIEKICSTQKLLESSERKREESENNLEHLSSLLKESRKCSALQAISHQEEVENLKSKSIDLEAELSLSQKRLKDQVDEVAEKEQQIKQQHTILQNIREEMEKAKEDNASMSSQLKDGTKQAQENSNRFNNLSKTKEKLEETLRNSRRELSIYRSQSQETESNLLSQIDALQSVLEEEKRQRRVFEAEILGLKEDKAKHVLTHSLAEHAEKTRRLNFLIKLKDDQVEALNKECETNATLIEQLRHRNADLESKTSLLEKRIERINSESSETLEECVRRCNEDYAKLEERSQNEITRLQDELRVANDEKMSCERDLAQLSRSLSQADKVKASLSAELHNLQKQTESIRSQLQEAQESNLQLQMDSSNSSVEANDSMSTASPLKGLSKQDLKTRCIDLQSDLGEMEDRVGFATEEAELRSMHLTQMNENLSRMKDEVRFMTNSNSKLEQSLRESLLRQEKSEEMVFNLQQEKESLVSDITAANIEMEAMRKRITEKDNMTESSQKESLKLIDDLRLKISQLQSENDALVETSRHLTSSCEELKSELCDARQRAAYLSSQLEKSKESYMILQSSRAEVQKELASCQLSRDTALAELNQAKAELEEERKELEQMHQDFKEALHSEQEKDRHCRTLEANAVVVAEKLSTAQNVTELAKEERNQATQKLATTTQALEALEAKLSQHQQTIYRYEEQKNALTQQVLELKVSAGDLAENDATSNEYVQSLEDKCDRLNSQIETFQTNEREINGKLHECRRQIASKESCNKSLLNRVDSLKSNLKSVRAQLEEARNDRKKLDLRCCKYDTTVAQKQMEIDQLQADLQILESTIARLRSGSLLRETNSTEDLNGPLSFDPPTKDSDGKHLDINRAVSMIDGLLCDIQQRFDAISVRTKEWETRGVVLAGSLNSLDLAGLDRHSNAVPLIHGTMTNLSELVARAQSDIAEQKQRLCSLHIGEGKDVPHGQEQKSGNDLSIVAKDFEEQLDTLLIDLKDANIALGEKDRLLERMHEISSAREAERSKLDARVVDLQGQLSQEQSWKEVAETELAKLRESVETDDGESPTVACQKAAAYLLLQTIEKRTLTAKAVAFRQWACHASAQQAVARQQQVATVLSEQLQETREKLKILKKHMKKSRRGRLNTIAETSKDEDDVSLESYA